MLEPKTSLVYGRYIGFDSPVFIGVLITCCPLFFSHSFFQSSESGGGESPETTDASAGSASRLNVQEVMKLVGVFEPSFSFLLLQLVKLMSTVKRKAR